MLATTILALSFCALTSLQYAESFKFTTSILKRDLELNMKTNEDFTYKINNRVSLRIDVPQNLKLIGSIKKSQKNGVFDFIEKNDQDPYAWSQIFSIKYFKEIAPQGDGILYIHDMLKNNKHLQKIKILHECSIVYPENYRWRELIITYSISQGEKEEQKGLLISLGISDTTSPNGNAINIQYARALDKDADESQEVEKMVDYLKEHHVINWENNKSKLVFVRKFLPS